VMPQPPADATGTARGVSTSQPAPETQAKKQRQEPKR